MSRSYLGKILLLLSTGIAAITSGAMAQDIQVVTYTNTVWVYNDSSTADNNPGTAWKEPGFVPVIGNGPNQWKANGKGLFGNDTSAVYNEPSDPFRGGILGFATPLDRNINGSAARITFYFITKFNWPHNPAGVILRGTNYLDDGAIVYLNGVEVFRSRVPGTVGVPPDWTQLGDNQGNEGIPEPLEYNATSLVTGENTLAVELHQSSAGSSDVAFATALRAVIPFAPVILNQNEPSDRAVVENRSTTLDGRGDGSPRPTYQWFKDGSPILDATNSTYTIARMQSTDAGSYMVTLINEFGTVSSRQAQVTFVPDTVKPKIVRVLGSATNNAIVVEYDEEMEFVSVTDLFSYTVQDLGPNSITLNPGNKSVTLNFETPFPDGITATLHVAGPTDLTGINVLDTADVQFQMWVPAGCAGALFEAFDTSSIAGNAVSDLTSHPNFPNKPRDTARLTSFSSKGAYPDDSHEQFGGRIRSLFIPPFSGNWVFYLSSDDASRLYLNPNGPGEGGKVLVQEEASCCNPYTNHTTAPFALEAGKAYYLEALYKEGTGGDNLHVWAGPQGVTPPSAVNSSLTANDAIPAGMLGIEKAPANVAGTFTITQQPANQTVVPNSTATFTVATSTDALLCYQWLRNGAPIPNAVGPTYTFTAASGDNGAVFSVEISIITGTTVTSANATLTVEPDVIRPTALSVTTDIAGLNVVVTFSEPMSAASVQNAANYTINGVSPVSATQTSPTTVTLVAASALQDCVRNALVITGAADTSSNPINPNPTTLNFTKPQFLVAQDATWRYEDTGADLGTAWRESAFDDSGWASGQGTLAREDDTTMPAGWPIRTVLANFTGARITMYFRTHFNLATDPRAITRLQLSTVVDDSAIYWVNGKQLHRLRVPTDPAVYNTQGDGAPSEAPHPIETFEVPAGDLKYGDNVLAVEVHQNGTASSDIVMGAELSATISACVPPLTVTRSGGNVILTWPDASFSLERAPAVTGPWTSQAGTTGVALPIGPGNAFLRLVKP